MPTPALVVFDLDGTLIDADCAQEWLIFIREKSFPGAADAERRCALIMESYASGRMDMHEYMRHWASPINGFSLFEIEKLAIEFAEKHIRQRLFPKGISNVVQHQKSGDTVLLISASPTLLVRPISNLLGIEHAIGLNLQVQQHKIKNSLIEPLSFQDGKLSCLQRWLEAQGFPHRSLDYAYSDSINDRPLLELANTAVVINGDELLLALSQKKGWRSECWRITPPK